ncbi:MAG: hypothetical protein M3O50_11030 [Myxococcota bacterium]|nr:hypothetical protein [Myxococcota bacterium]
MPAAPPAPAAVPQPVAAPPPAVAVVGTNDVPETSPRPPPRLHRGLYLRIDPSGVGYSGLSGSGPRGSASISGLASYAGVSLGGSPVPGLAIAGTIWGASFQGDFSGGPFEGARLAAPAAGTSLGVSAKASATFGEIGLLFDYYPDPAGGWHAGATIGIGVAGIMNHADDSSWGGVALLGGAFAGYAWWIGREWSLGISAVGAGASGASLRDSTGKDTGYQVSPVTFGLQTSILYY